MMNIDIPGLLDHYANYKEKKKQLPILTWNIETTRGNEFNLTCELEEFPAQFFMALNESGAVNDLEGILLRRND
jgi:hypothetical protein